MAFEKQHFCSNIEEMVQKDNKLQQDIPMKYMFVAFQAILCRAPHTGHCLLPPWEFHPRVQIRAYQNRVHSIWDPLNLYRLQNLPLVYSPSASSTWWAHCVGHSHCCRSLGCRSALCCLGLSPFGSFGSFALLNYLTK